MNNTIERLRDSDLIYQVIKVGKRAHSNVANLFYKKSNLQSSRLAIVVSKKISNRSVVRNKVKRQVRAIVREMKINPGCNDMVIIVKPEWLNHEYCANKNVLFGMFRKVGGVVRNGK